MILGALTAQVINSLVMFLAADEVFSSILNVLISVIMPAAILVINVVVVIQVRRSAINAVANLGVQPHHQSSSSVPTIMLITTSLIYVLLNTVRGIVYTVRFWTIYFTSDLSDETFDFLTDCYFVSFAMWQLIFAYNFYVYLITGKQFRSDLHRLLCRCFSSSSSSLPPPAVIVAAAVDDAEVERRDIADTAV